VNARAVRRAEQRIGSVPRVDLRPPSVVAREKDQSMLAWSVLIFILVLALIGGGATLASMRRTAALAELDGSQAQLRSITQTQVLYGEVREVETAIALLNRAAAVGTAHEVRWSAVIRQLLAAVPADAVVGSITATAPAVADPAPEPASPLRQPRVGTLTIVVAATSIQQVAEYAKSLRSLVVVADVSVDSVVDGLGTLTVNLSDVALSGRFVDGIKGADASPQPAGGTGAAE